MKSFYEIQRGLECCGADNDACFKCPYAWDGCSPGHDHPKALMSDALVMVREYQSRFKFLLHDIAREVNNADDANAEAVAARLDRDGLTKKIKFLEKELRKRAEPAPTEWERVGGSFRCRCCGHMPEFKDIRTLHFCPYCGRLAKTYDGMPMPEPWSATTG